ncbi:MAG: D-alanyl-D-alanine carboxypeptidase family protein [Pseudomonadota bacterium]
MITGMITRALALAAAVTATCATSALTQSFDTRATAAFVVDHGTGTVLLNKNAQTPLPPASMSKLMTLLMTFEAIESGALSVNDRLPVSAYAASRGGSTMFLDPRDRVSVEDLIRGIIVLSGNDACIVLAEALSPDGTEDGFARLMTERARELGMVNSTFKNSTGWPAVGHRMSMEDLAILAEALITDFAAYYPLFAEQEFAFDGRAPANTRNRNPLLGLGIGADGLKTGHTQEAGFGLVGSAQQGDRRVTFVVNGLPSAQARAEESEKIVNWAFRQFAEQTAFAAGTQIAQADVHMGAELMVGLETARDITLLVPRIGTGEVTAQVTYTGPLRAPIAKGDALAELIITVPGFEPVRAPLVASHDVARGGFVPTMRTAAQALMRRVLGPAPASQDPAS